MPSRLRPLAVVFALALGTGLTGCITPATIVVHHSEVRGVTMAGADVVIYLQVTNHTPVDVRVRDIRCNVTIGRGYALAPLALALNQPVGAGQTVVFPVNVSVPMTIAGPAASEAGAGGIPFHVSGIAGVVKPDGNAVGYRVELDGAIPRQAVADATRSMLPTIPFFGR